MKSLIYIISAEIFKILFVKYSWGTLVFINKFLLILLIFLLRIYHVLGNFGAAKCIHYRQLMIALNEKVSF
jgi:hypothetical protein